jgi:ectoine hydroxylase-related dioxygenase (phytanoyl-CoA dioxygenase family)
MSQIQTLGIREFHRNESAEDFAVEELRTIGYAIIDSGIAPEELAYARKKIDEIYDLQVLEVGSEDRLRAMRDANVARALLAYDEFFLSLATHPTVLAIAGKLLGEYFILMLQNGAINRPTESRGPLPWHRDLNWQHFVSSRPLSLSAFWAIDDFNVETGGTGILPATHKLEEFPSDEYCERHEQTVNMAAGSILLFDSMLYHRSGHNTSGRLRRGVNHMYTLALIKQQISFPRMLAGKYRNDDFLRKFLGYDTETGESVQQWRESKLAMIGA